MLKDRLKFKRVDWQLDKTFKWFWWISFFGITVEEI